MFSLSKHIDSNHQLLPTGAIAKHPASFSYWHYNQPFRKAHQKKALPLTLIYQSNVSLPTTSAQCSPLPPCTRSSSTFSASTQSSSCVLSRSDPWSSPWTPSIAGLLCRVAGLRNRIGRTRSTCAFCDWMCSAPVRFTLKVQCLRFFSSNIYSFM